MKVLNPSAVQSNPVRGNDAITGAKMAGLAGPTGQAQTAVAGNPDLVLIEIGANDVCTSSVATLTSLSSFQANLTDCTGPAHDAAAGRAEPGRLDPEHLQPVERADSNASARLIWGLGGICQSMLASPTDLGATAEARRQTVKQRNIDFNTILKNTCAQYIHCRYDDDAAFNINFLASDVGTNDYFHPNTNGQAKAAAAAWAAGPNYADLTAPTTTIARDRGADGIDDWYRNDVTVTLSSDDADYNGSEFFYKLTGEVDQPWTKYTGPVTITTEGQTELTARSVDVNGNIEASKTDLIKIDRTSPTFDYSCTTPVLLNGPATATIANAADNLSGFDSDPNGSAALDTSAINANSSTVEIQDRAGNTATRSCSYDVRYVYGGLQQPVNIDGSSIFKLNSAVPLKFKLTDAIGLPISGAVAKLSAAKVTNAIEGTFVEADAKGNSSTGNIFSQDGAGQYHYNLDSKTLSTGTWSLKITLDDGASYTTRISLR